MIWTLGFPSRANLVCFRIMLASTSPDTLRTFHKEATKHMKMIRRRRGLGLDSVLFSALGHET